MVSLCHVNAVVDGYESALEHFTDLYGAVLNLEAPDNGERRACLISIGDVILELVAPSDPHASHGRGALLRRVGRSLRRSRVQSARRGRGAPAMPAARAADHHGPGALLLHRWGELHGVSWEIFDQDWTFLLSFDNPERHDSWVPVPTELFWRDEHPLGLTGLVRLSIAVEDLDHAADRLAAVAGAEVVYRADRPQVEASATGLKVGDTVLELLAPTAPGPVRAYLDRYGERIRSIVFGVLDLGRAERHLATKGVELMDGDAPRSRAVPAELNHGLLFELTEEPVNDP